MADQKAAKTPTGVVAIFTSNDGRVVASACDFIREAPGGCSLREGQESRVRRTLQRKVVYEMCNDHLASVMGTFTLSELVLEMERKHGYRTTIIHVGGEDETR